MATHQRPLLCPLQILHHPLQVKRANLPAAAERQVAVGAGFYFDFFSIVYMGKLIISFLKKILPMSPADWKMLWWADQVWVER